MPHLKQAHHIKTLWLLTIIASLVLLATLAGPAAADTKTPAARPSLEGARDPAPGSAENIQRHQLDALTIQTPPPGVQDRWPFYNTTKYLKIEEYDIHILGTETVSDWFMRESFILIRNMVASLKDPESRHRFTGHRAYLVTDGDPAITANGLRNTSTETRGKQLARGRHID